MAGPQGPALGVRRSRRGLKAPPYKRVRSRLGVRRSRRGLKAPPYKKETVD